MRVVIFANGEFRGRTDAADLCASADLILAADGGTRHALAIGVAPDVVIGDLDSLSAEERANLEAAGSDIVPFSSRKDETDLELALLRAVDVGASQIVILAALGGRLDQTLANLLLLTLPELDGIDVRLVDGAQTGFVLRPGSGGALIEGLPGDTVSLIPLLGDAGGVTTQGLEWPLEEDTLRFGHARGVSNVLTAHQARVDLKQGLLLCAVTRGQEHEWRTT